MWERVVFRGSTTPLPQGGGAPALPKFWGFLSIYAYTHCRRTTKFDVVTHMGRNMFSGGQPRNCTCTNASRGLSAKAEFLVKPKRRCRIPTLRYSTGTTDADGKKICVFDRDRPTSLINGTIRAYSYYRSLLRSHR